MSYMPKLRSTTNEFDSYVDVQLSRDDILGI
jgi:hypothetical protein